MMSRSAAKRTAGELITECLCCEAGGRRGAIVTGESATAGGFVSFFGELLAWLGLRCASASGFGRLLSSTS